MSDQQSSNHGPEANRTSVSRRRFVGVAGLLGLGAAGWSLAACQAAPSPSPGPAKSSAGEPWKIGMHQPVTGPLALIGIQGRNGALMAWDEINAKGGILGRQVDLLVEDAGVDNTAASNSFNRIVSQKPIAVVGTVATTQMLAISETIKREGLVVVYGSTGTPVSRQGIPWLFRIMLHQGQSSRLMVRFVKNTLKKSRIGSIHVNEEYGNSGHDAVVEEVQKLGGIQIVANEGLPANDKDFTAQLLRVKNAGADIIFTHLYAGQHLLVLKQRKQLGIDLPIIGDTGLSDVAILSQVSEEEADGLYSGSAGVPQAVDTPEAKQWIAAYKEKYKSDPTAYTTNYYDGVYLLAQAIEQSKGESRAAVRDALTKVKRKGLLYEFAFDQYGDGVPWTVITRTDKRNPKVVEALRWED